MPSRTNSSPLTAEDCSLEPIAIVGMACRLPGEVGSPAALWDVLVNKTSTRSAKVPISRFNIDAHLHENLERPGSFTAKGGYFLDGAPENFDPTFFGITPVEATWMDPQQRKILEVAYECLESAGLSLDAVSGSNTAVFIGSFTSDYQQMTVAESSFRHPYAATGVDPGIISNRIGNVFNLVGPSFTINTACSSSIYAIHNACHALRARDCEAAIAGGVNLILTVDQHMNTAKLGVLSPTSTCHTFDALADGYGRAEGAGALYLKRLSDAIRDGDPVRGVIRSSAVNTNGKVAGTGITYPSLQGQSRVIRQAYKRANLDPQRTIYTECHGTGTPVGDPIEVRAVSDAMNDSRSKEQPLLLGAVKANIGHSEAASGIFAVMKAALMTEAGVIPGVAGFKNINPAIREKEWNVKINAETTSWPEDGMARRAGVSSFGYGGTNGHVIVEEVNSLYPWYQHGKAKSSADYDHSSSKPFLIILSAHDKITLCRNIEAHARVADKYYLADLAFTLNNKRTVFPHRGFSIVREGDEAKQFALPAFKLGVAPKVVPDLAFVFTGQGAQWAGMGVEAMQTFSTFSQTIKALDRVLQNLQNPPSWTLESAISTVGEASKINDPEVAQPVTTAIQIAIVDLFSSWGIHPTVSLGHSSGEIAAAYSAGCISAPEAIIAAYLRGYAVKRNSPAGTMLAVGLGAEEVLSYIADLAGVVIACENSPSSVTLSGSTEGIQKAKDRLTAENIFARELKTGKAYHSPQMAGVAIAYDEFLGQAVADLGRFSLDWRQPRTKWISSVTGNEFSGDLLTTGYWSRNLRNRVLFNSAVTAVGNVSEFEGVRCFVEIGPHSALKGPLKQIFKANQFDRFAYIPTLLRGEDSSDALLNTAGSLLVQQNYPVDLEAVNAVEHSSRGPSQSIIKSSLLPLMLVDLPPYQWNYDKTYWAEPRASREQRQIKYPRHDILGMRIVGLSDGSLLWRNHLRHKDIPWLKDHKLGKVDVFPAAGHLSLAIEALRQVSESKGIDIKGASFQDVSIETALIIPEDEDGIEIQFRLFRPKKTNTSSTWYSFVVESVTDEIWTTHCEGKIKALLKVSKDVYAASQSPVDISQLPQHVTSKRWYTAFNRVGFEYGDSFQRLGPIRSDRKCHKAAADVEIVTESGLMRGEESRYILHPSTIDSCLHLVIIAIYAGLHKEMDCGVVPVNIEQMSIFFPPPLGEDKTFGNSIAWVDPRDPRSRYFNAHTKLYTKSGDLMMDMKNLRAIKYPAAIPQRTMVERPRAPYMQTCWKPDYTTMLNSKSKFGLTSTAEVIELLDHKEALKQILFVGGSEKSIQAILLCLSPITLVTICDTSAEKLETLQTAFGSNPRITTRIMKGTSFNSDSDEALPLQDAIILDAEVLPEVPVELLLSIKTILGDSGKLIVQARQEDNNRLVADNVAAAGFSEPKLQVNFLETSISLYGLVPYLNGVVPTPETITLLTVDRASSKTADLASSLRDDYRTVEVVDVNDSSSSNFKNQKIVIDDNDGSVLSSLTETSFTTLKIVLLSSASIVWVTSGVNEGKNVDGSMVQGFLRAIRSEQASAKITLLDIDRASAPEDVSRAIISKLKHAATKDSGADTEFWLHNNSLQINRVISNTPLNEAFQHNTPPAEILSIPAGRDRALQGLLVDGEIIFSQDAKVENGLLANEVEVQVLTAEFHHPQGRHPRIVAGTILNEGSAVSPSMLGQQVIMYATDSFSTVLRTPVSATLPVSSDLAAVDLVASLPKIAQVWNALVNIAKVQSGDHVLVLPAPLDVVAVISALAPVLGFKLTVIVDSGEKPEDLARHGTEGETFLLASEPESIKALMSSPAESRPNIVLSHDFLTLSQDIWRAMPAMGRFVLCESRIDMAPDVLPFIRGASFLSASIKNLLQQDPATLGKVLKSSMKALVQSKDRRLLKKGSPISIGSLKGAEELEETKSINNAVITYGYERDTVKIQSISSSGLRLRPDATYLLVGCLGGLGRSLTTWMMERGAKSFVFISRSGADQPEAARVVASIHNAGLEAQVYRADISNEGEVTRVLKSITRPIRGVVHAAMVLQDTMFERMTYDNFMAAVIPKVNGARSLHAALQNTDLDFFVMTSSISATLGNPGQANYCAGNSFLDGLAWHRTLAGLPGVSLILPMVLDVGVVAENEKIEMSLTRQAMYGIDEREMLRGFETAMTTTTTTSIGNAQIILGLEPAYLAASVTSETADAYWLRDARFRNLCHTVSDIAQGDRAAVGQSDGNFAGQLKAALEEGPEAAIQAIASHVMQRCSRILMVALEDFSVDGASIGSYGLDSMIGAELRNWLFREFGLDISFQHLLAPTVTFRKLACTIAETLGINSAKSA